MAVMVDVARHFR